MHVVRRGTSAQAAQLVRSIIGTRDERARTAHDIAADTDDRAQLPERVQHLLARRANAVHARRAAYQQRHDENLDRRIEWQRVPDQRLSRSQDQALDYGIEL